MSRFELLDLRLLLTRQPVLAALLLVLCALLGSTLFKPPQERPVFASNGNPARLLSAQQNFRQLLIPISALPSTQQAILELAANQSLSVGQVDYHQESESAGKFIRATMRLPLNGRYANLRRFITTLLADYPALAILDLNIEVTKGEDTDAVLAATLTVQLLLGEARHD